MKSLRIIFLCLTAVTCTQFKSAGQPSYDTDYHRRNLVYEITGQADRYNPSMLSLFIRKDILDETASCSWIGGSIDFSDGKLHHPMVSGQCLLGTVHTESFMQFTDKGWYLHGIFEYANGFEKDGSGLLSHTLRKNGTPTYHYNKIPADRWGIRKYQAAATVAKTLGPRWSIGISADWCGHQYFRSNDVRNDQTELEMQLAAGAAFRFWKESWLSLTATWNRNKERPEFSNLYPSGKDGKIYFIAGAGSYINNFYDAVCWTESIPGMKFQWSHRSEKWDSNLSYRFRYGNNWWKKDFRQKDGVNEWADYAFTGHEAGMTEKLKTGSSEFLLQGNFRYTGGSGKHWNRVAEVYLDNYRYSGTATDLTFTWIGELPVLRKISAFLRHDAERRLDKSYDYRFFNTGMDLGLSAGLDWKIRSVSMAASLSGNCYIPIRTLNSPGAADNGKNIYYPEIGIPLEQWYSTGRAGTGLVLQADIPAGKTKIDLQLSAGGTFFTGGAEIYQKTSCLTSSFHCNVWF